MTSQILLDAQVFCPTNYTHFAIFTPFITLERGDTEKQQIAFFSLLNNGI